MHIALTRREHPLQVPDGINVFIFSLAGALIRAGHRVSVVSAAASDEGEIAAHFHLPEMPRIYGLTDRKEVGYGRLPVVWARAGRRLFAELAPDAVLVNGVIPWRLAGLNVGVCHDMERRRAPWLPDIRRAYRSFSYRRADAIVATCSEIRDDLAVELRRPAGKIAVIPTCIDNSSYRVGSGAGRRRAVLHMGTPGYKNPVATVRAFALVSVDDAELFVTGKPTAELDAAIAELAEAKRARVHKLGFVSEEELRELLATVRAVAVPSEYSTPVASPTVLEAFASGTPVAASRSISGDLLEPGRNGFVDDPADAAAMARSLTTLLTDDLEWEQLSRGASKAAAGFDADRVAAAYVEMVAATASGLS